MRMSYPTNNIILNDKNFEALEKAVYLALKQGDIHHASDMCKDLMKYHGKRAESHFIIGLVALEARDFQIALKAFQSALGLRKNFPAAAAYLARIYAQMGAFENARKALSFISLSGDITPVTADVIALVLTLIGDHKAALAWHEKAVTGSDQNIPDTEKAKFQLNKARCHIFLGQEDKALQALEKAMLSSDLVPEALWMKARLIKGNSSLEMPEIAEMEQGITAPGAPKDKAYLGYGLGKLREDQQNWQAAFEAYTEGAKAKKELVHFDLAEEKKSFSALHKYLGADFWYRHQTAYPSGESGQLKLAKLAEVAEQSALASPIFITGLPRTGSTLVERMLGSHQSVIALGELQHFQAILRSALGVQGQGLPCAERLSGLASLSPHRLGQDYIKRVGVSLPQTGFYTDKLPLNSLFAPLIAAALPTARIVLVERDPLDACFAIFKHLFADAYPWSYDLDQIADYYNLYQGLINQYKSIMGPRLITVRYEDLVTEPKITLINLCQKIGIPFSADMLDYYKSKEAVSTASASQVRQKTYDTSIGKARLYGDRLEPLLRKLTEKGIKFK